MTFSEFAKLLRQYDGQERTNGTFVLDLIESSLEPVTEPDSKSLETYNPIESEENARKYFDGTRKISRGNFRIISNHYYRGGFVDFLGTLLNNDDKVRLLVSTLQEEYPNTNEENVEDTCAEIFERIIANCDAEYAKKSKNNEVPKDQKDFKEKVFKIFSKLVDTEKWPFQSTKYKICMDKFYYLPSEDKEESFDIAIENYNSDNSDPALRIILKCKSSSAPISKDDLVLFENSVKRVNGFNKALFVSNASFDEEAVRYANISGIALLRIFDDEKIRWLAPRYLDSSTNESKNSKIENVENEREIALIDNDYTILNNFAVGVSRGHYYAELSALFNSIIGNGYNFRISNSDLFGCDSNLTNPLYVKYLSDNELSSIADSVLYDMYGEKWDSVKKVDIENLVLYIKTRFGFSINFFQMPKSTVNQKAWGYVDYENKVIYIDGIYETDLHLVKFSIAHELSHLILHEDLLKSGMSNFRYFCASAKQTERMEIQANKLASSIILPKNQFFKEFYIIIKDYYLNYSRGYFLYLDDQECNQQQFREIANKLTCIFDVSKTHLKNKLLDLGWLKLSYDKVCSPLNFTCLEET